MADDTRERILAACARTIAAHGLARFRMQEVAREAGVSIGLLSYHFGDRDGLLQAALDSVNTGTVERAAHTPEGPDAASRLATLLCSEFGDAPRIRDGSIVWNELRAAAVFAQAQAAALSRSTASWQASVRELIEQTQVDTLGQPAPEPESQTPSPSGIVPPSTSAPASDLALILTALVEGLSGRWLSGQLTASEAQATIRTTLNALGLSLR